MIYLDHLDDHLDDYLFIFRKYLQGPVWALWTYMLSPPAPTLPNEKISIHFS